MAIMGVASITPAIPAVAESLSVSPTRIGLLITLFTLPGAVLTPVLGVLADRWGRKRVLVPSLFVFGLAGTACAAAPGFATLLVLRLVQGVGAASLGAINVTLIGDLYQAERRSAAMGYNASVLSIGTALYPAVGGALALLGWRYPFALPALSIVVGAAVLLWLDNPEPAVTQRLGEYLRGALASMRRATVIGLFFASVATFVLLYGCYLTYIPLRMRENFGSSSLAIGLVLSGGSLATAIVSSQLGRLTSPPSRSPTRSHRLRRPIPHRRLIQAGFVLYLGSLVLIPAADGAGTMLVPVVMFGTGNGINIPTIMNLLASHAPMQYRAAFMAFNGTLLRTGQTLGPPLMGGAFALWGPTGPFYAGAGLAAASLALLLPALRGDVGRGAQPEP